MTPFQANDETVESLTHALKQAVSVIKLLDKAIKADNAFQRTIDYNTAKPELVKLWQMFEVIEERHRSWVAKQARTAPQRAGGIVILEEKESDSE